MNKPYCYIIYLNNEEFKVKPTLKGTIELAYKELYYPSYYIKHKELPIEAYFIDKVTDVDIRYFIEQIDVTPEQIKELTEKIDKTIESCENAIRNKQCCSGIKYWTKKDRPEMINKEILFQSYKWRELDKIDWDNIPETVFLEQPDKVWEID